MVATPINQQSILTSKVAPQSLGGLNLVTFNIDFTGVGSSYLLNLTSQQQAQLIGVPRTLFIDNSSNPNNVVVNVGVTNQQFEAPPYSNGFYTLASAPGAGLITLTSQGGATSVGNVAVFDYVIAPFVWTNVPSAGGSAVTIADGASVTLGTKADAAVVNPAASATEMAVLKGILTEALILVKPAVVYTQTVVTLVAGVSNNFLAANANRRALRWMNVGLNPCTVAPGAGAVTVGSGMQYNGAAGAGFQGGSETLNADSSTQAFSAISTTGTTLVVWEGI